MAWRSRAGGAKRDDVSIETWGSEERCDDEEFSHLLKAQSILYLFTNKFNPQRLLIKMDFLNQTHTPRFRVHYFTDGWEEWFEELEWHNEN